MAKFVLTAQLQLQPPRNVAAVARQIQNQLNNIKVNVAVSGASAASKNLNKKYTEIPAKPVAPSFNPAAKLIPVS